MKCFATNKRLPRQRRLNIEKKCLRCGTSFHPFSIKKRQGKYCSVRCRNEANRKPTPKCKRCGGLMPTPRGHSKQYCSPYCNYAYKREVTAARCTKKCERCGILFVRTDDRSALHYCSKKCLAEQLAEKKTSKSRLCKLCNKIFLPCNSKRRYCSLQCSATSRRIETTAYKAANWQTKCLHCGNIFIQRDMASKTIYCSAACCYSARKIAAATPKLSECWECGVCFPTNRSQQSRKKKGKAIYCTKRCKYASMARLFRKKPVQLVCPNCKCLFERRGSAVSYAKKIYGINNEENCCSRKCANGFSGAKSKLEANAYAAASGWPDGLLVSSVAILNKLAEAGVPLTAHQLADAVRLKSKNSVFSYTSQLCDRMLIVKLPRWEKGKDGINYKAGYTLSPYALSILEERAKCENGK